MLILIAGKSYESKSQTTDTLCFPVPVIQKLLIDAKQKKYADSLVLVYRSDINILSGKIQALEIKDSTNKEINSTYQAMIGTMKDQRVILENQITYLNKEVKKWKRKNTWTAVGGLVLTGIVTGLFIFK